MPSRAQRLLAPLLVALLLVPPTQASARQSTDTDRRQQALATLERQAGTPLDVRWNNRGFASVLMNPDPTRPLPYTPSATEQGDPRTVALGFLARNRALFGLEDPQQQLQLLRIEPDPRLNYAHVRLDQVYHGIPVFGKQLVVHLDPQQRVMAVNGQFAPAIDVATEPGISAKLAEDTALQNLRDNQLDLNERLTVQTDVRSNKTRLMVYVDSNGKPTLTWQVTIVTTAPLGEWIVFVNAGRPRVVHAIDKLANAKRRQTFTANNGTRLPGRQLIDEGERSRDPVAQAAQDAAGIVYDYYFNNFKRDSIDGRGLTIVSTVHYGSSEEDAENAAWVGEAQQMIYGDGGQIFKPLPYGLDVVGHELTHGVTDNTSQLVYETQSGALNEAYSDIMGAMIDDKNWTVGEQVVKSPPYPVPYLRSLEDPTLGGRYDPNNPLDGVGQPGTVAEYADLPASRRSDNGGVHINSGIPAHAAFFVAQALGREKTGQIYYRTLTQYLTPEAQFSDYATLTIRAAQELYGAAGAQAATDAMAKVGLANGSGSLPDQPAPSEQPGPGQPVPDPTLPAGCSDLIVNGDFETDQGWQFESSVGSTLIDTELPHTGKRSVWLGGTDKESLQYAYQDVQIPANVTKAQLSYWRLIHRETSGVIGALLSSEATFSTLLARTSGESIATLEELDSSKADDSWRQVTFDLARYAGQTVRLVYSVQNPTGNVSSMFVDDVVLSACTTGTGPAAPPPDAQGTIYIQGKLTDASTGRGVPGAQIYVIKPGLSATDAAADDTITSDEVAAYGTADNSGAYQLNTSIPVGKSYSVIVLARGYRSIVADNGITVPQNAKNPSVVNIELRRG